MDADIRRKIEDLAEAIRHKDVDRLMAHYAPENITFDVQPPLKVDGAAAYRENFERWFSIIDGDIGYDVSDLRIAASEDVAFVHSLCKVTSKRINGESVNYSVRVTSGLRKINGAWLITHEHVSLPVDMRTMQASTDA
jgi:ketosteroid isomerase-like protein